MFLSVVAYSARSLAHCMEGLFENATASQGSPSSPQQDEQSCQMIVLAYSDAMNTVYTMSLMLWPLQDAEFFSLFILKSSDMILQGTRMLYKSSD
jgi:hypothetical protein